jgi:hypothetical protein
MDDFPESEPLDFPYSYADVIDVIKALICLHISDSSEEKLQWKDFFIKFRRLDRLVPIMKCGYNGKKSALY